MSRFTTSNTTAVFFEQDADLDEHARDLATHIGGVATPVGPSFKRSRGLLQRALLLTVMHKKVDHLYCDLFCNPGGTAEPAPGLVTGLNLEEVEQAIARMKVPKTYGDRPWMISEPQTKLVADSVDLFAMDSLIHAAWAGVLSRQARFAIIAGHGREDILSVGSRKAFCGRRLRTGGASAPDCHKNACSYPQVKIPIEGINAEILVLLSCNAGRIGDGLMPASARLALTASRTCRAVIAPRRLYTHHEVLTDLVLALLLRGGSAADVVRAANALQLEVYGESDVFVIFGDPDAAPQELSCPKTHTRPEVSDRFVMPEKIGNVIEFIDDMASAGIAHADLDAVRPAASKLETLLHSAIVPQEIISKGQRLLGLLEWLLQTTAQEILERTATGYFWFSSRYRLLPGDESVIECPLCRSACYEQEFAHVRMKSRNRVRQTCSVCGIVEDRPARDTTILTFDTNLVRSACRSATEIKLSVTKVTGAAYLALGLNGVGAIIDGLPVLKVGTTPATDPIALEAGATELTITVETDVLRPGLFFLKVYVVSLAGIAEHSLPIRTWTDVSHEP
ncbi:hypothetical protein [Roseibium album]|uniref:hypothetical protein n=1 Tax=Roseibium album TaxID=311410 RepID=UPI00391DC456